jgi:hypothetical protein
MDSKKDESMKLESSGGDNKEGKVDSETSSREGSAAGSKKPKSEYLI